MRSEDDLHGTIVDVGDADRKPTVGRQRLRETGVRCANEKSIGSTRLVVQCRSKSDETRAGIDGEWKGRLIRWENNRVMNQSIQTLISITREDRQQFRSNRCVFCK